MSIETNQPQHRRALGTVYARQGTPYPCTQATVDKVQRLALMNDLQTVCVGTAVTETIEINSEKKPSPAKRAAIDRLLAAIALPTVEWEADIIIKMFSDLDTVFFDGYLTGNASVRWAPSENFTYPESSPMPPWGQYFPAGRGLCRILLNADTIPSKYLDFYTFTPGKQMWSTMLH